MDNGFIYAAARVLISCFVFAYFLFAPLRNRFRYNYVKTGFLAFLLIAITIMVTVLFLIPGKSLEGYTVWAILFWLTAAVLIFHLAIIGSFWEILFIVLVILNLYVNIIAIAKVSLCVMNIDFSNSVYGSVMVLGILVAYLPLLWILFNRLYRQVIDYNLQFSFWRFIWLIPALTYMIFYVKIVNDYWRAGIVPNTYDVAFIILWSFTTYVLFWVTLQMLILVYKGIITLSEVKMISSQLHIQEEQYKRLLEESDNITRIRHDWRHHLLTLNGFAEAGENEALKEYVRELLPIYVSGKEEAVCQNHVVDIILRYYLEDAKKSGIVMGCKADILNDIEVSDIDLCIIFGNLIENAVTACKKQGQEDKMIEVKAYIQGSQLIAMIKNTYSGLVDMRNGICYSTKHGGRGIGISSARNVVEKYDGQFKIDYDGLYFTVFVLLNFSEEDSE